MARIRSIHPGILTDEAFMTLTVECPLAIALLVGLWMHADDAGVFEWKPVTLKAAILPAITGDFLEIMEELVRNSFVKSFDNKGRRYGVIRNFSIYQRPKSPKDIHPATDEMREYAGFVDGKRPRSDTGRPPQEVEFGTTSGIYPQRKEEGEGIEINYKHTSPSISEGEGGFEKFWELIPKDEFASRPKAAKAWSGLTVAERVHAIAAIPALKSAKPTTHKLSPERYLTEKRFASHAESRARVATHPKQVRIERQSPQGDAWERYLREANNGKGAAWANGVWWFETEWPPSRLEAVQ